MNWEAAVEIYIEVLQNPRATAGTVIGAKEDLRRLARNADELKAHIGQLQEALGEASDRMREEVTASNRDRSLAAWLRKRLANDRPGDRDIRKELENLLKRLEGGES